MMCLTSICSLLSTFYTYVTRVHNYWYERKGYIEMQAIDIFNQSIFTLFQFDKKPYGCHWAYIVILLCHFVKPLY